MIVDMFVTCGSLSDAVEVLSRLLQPSALSYNSVISAYSAGGQAQEVVRFYRRMQAEGVRPNKSIFFSVVKACSCLVDLAQGRRVHADIVERGYGSDAYLVTSLVDMYAKCGSILEARHVFDSLCDRSVVSWNAMISGYAHHQEPEEALNLYDTMLREGHDPDSWTFVGALKACSCLAVREAGILVNGQLVKQKSHRRGRIAHDELVKRGFAFEPNVVGTLIHMYAKCGSMVDAQAVFDSLPKRNMLSWNAIIGSYVQQGHAEKALHLYSEMMQEGVAPNSWTFVSALKACSMLAEVETTSGSFQKLGCLNKGKAIHQQVMTSVHGSDVFISNTLVHMYAKCGSITDARRVFDTLSDRDAVSWNAMIAGYAEADQALVAMQMYEDMKREGVVPDNRTFIGVLKACSFLADMEKATVINDLPVKFDSLRRLRRIHDEINQRGCGADIYLATRLVDMYAKCGSIVDAQHVFESLSNRNGAVWNALIGGYAALEQGETALKLYCQMMEAAEVPNSWIFVSVLKACGGLAAKEHGAIVYGHLIKVASLQMCRSIHAEVCEKGCESHLFVGAALVDVYAACGSIADARHVFDSMVDQNVVSWSTIIARYADQAQGEEALQLYAHMQDEGIEPNQRTYASVLSALGSLAAEEKEISFLGRSMKLQTLQRGKCIHCAVIEGGFESDVFVSNGLVHMYAKCGSIEDATRVFELLSQRDAVAWNAMILGYAEQLQGEKALLLYAQMQEEGITTNNWIYVSMLKACSCLADVEGDTSLDGGTIKVRCLHKGKTIHAELVETGYGSDVFIGNTLVYLYAKCGSLGDARAVFEALPKRDVVSWNCLISGYSAQGEGERAMQLYPQMLEEGVLPDESTFLCILKACSNIGALNMCTWIHEDIAGDEAKWSPSVRNNLIHAYGKCGNMVKAKGVFDMSPHRDVVSWNSLMAGYARQGECERTLQCYNEMQQAGIKPDTVTFLCILTACSHAGMVDRGLQFFVSMARDHGLSATWQHYACIVDLLSRAGLLEEAEDLLLHNMPMQPDLAMWLSLLNACRKYGSVQLGRRAFDRAVALDPTHRAAYILMSNIYAHAGMQEEAIMIEGLKGAAGALERPGQSWVEHGDNVQVFEAGTSYQRNRRVVGELKQLSAQITDPIHVNRFFLIPLEPKPGRMTFQRSLWPRD